METLAIISLALNIVMIVVLVLVYAKVSSTITEQTARIKSIEGYKRSEKFSPLDRWTQHARYANATNSLMPSAWNNRWIDTSKGITQQRWTNSRGNWKSTNLYPAAPSTRHQSTGPRRIAYDEQVFDAKVGAIETSVLPAVKPDGVVEHPMTPAEIKNPRANPSFTQELSTSDGTNFTKTDEAPVHEAVEGFRGGKVRRSIH